MMEMIYQDIPRTYTAIAEVCACVVYLLLMKKRIKGKKWFGFLTLMAVVQIVYMEATGKLPIIFWVPAMIGAVMLMFLVLHKGGKAELIVTQYYCAKAFLLAELAASLEWQLHVFFFQDEPVAWYLMLLQLVLVYAAIFTTAYFLEKKIWKEEYMKQMTKKEVLVAMIIAAGAFVFSNLSYLFSNTPFTSKFQTDIFIIRTLTDLGGLAILFSFQSRIGEYMAEKELMAIQSAYRTQYEQYRNYQESIERQNLKYHDLKHQIIGLRAETDPKKREEWIDGLEKEVDEYQSVFQTGNKVLDTILDSKMFQCKKHQIHLTCVVDGKLLESMHVRDVCTIFGNALDNAIENVVLVQDERKRLIHLSVSAQRGFVLISVENYCERAPQSQKGELPRTSKKDKVNHGYGMKSMQYTVEKYEGSLNWSIKENWFYLRMLLPMK